MLDKEVVKEAIKMSHEGASTKDLHTYLFVSPDEFMSWFNHGKAFVDEGYGRDSVDELKADGDLDDFDILCLLLYKGVMSAKWGIKKQMHRLVSESDNPNLGFKYLEAVYASEFDPKYAETDPEKSEEDESATSFVMDNFFKQHRDDAYNEEDGKFLEETDDSEVEDNAENTEQELQQEE